MRNFEEARGSRDDKTVTVSVKLTTVSGELVIAELQKVFLNFRL